MALEQEIRGRIDYAADFLSSSEFLAHDLAERIEYATRRVAVGVATQGLLPDDVMLTFLAAFVGGEG